MDDAVTNEKRDSFDDALTKDGFHEFGNWICLSGPAHTVTNTWEPNRDVLSLKENKVGTTVVSAYGYSVNSIGQRTGLNQSGTAFSSARSIGWGYDAMGQVILNDSSIAGFDWAYLYDSIGNRTKEGNAVTLPRRSNRAPQFNPLNQFTGYVTQTTSGNIPVLTTSHDDDGNATAYPLPVATTVNSTLAWDAENRLVSTTTNGVTTNYVYDSQSRRIAVTAGGSTKVTVYDGWNPITDYANGSLVRSYQWGQDLSGTLQKAGGVGGLLALTSGSQTYDPSYDGNGNVSEYLDGSGAIAAHFEYNPFGQTTVDTDSSGIFDIRFSTKRRDVETGLYYYGYRYYDPVSGRWPSKDPIEERGGVNLYEFVGNNGINSWDRLGLDPLGKGVNSGECCGGKQLDTALNCCINGVQISTSEKVKVKLCKRPANMPGGGFFSNFGMNHEFLAGPDGPPVGMGPKGTNGNPGPSYPGVPTELTDHLKESQSDCREFEVSRCEFAKRTRPGTDTGRWTPPTNDCNTCARRIIQDSGGPQLLPSDDLYENPAYQLN